MILCPPSLVGLRIWVSEGWVVCYQQDVGLISFDSSDFLDAAGVDRCHLAKE